MKRRNWRYPVGVGAAASGLLALLLWYASETPSPEIAALDKLPSAHAQAALCAGARASVRDDGVLLCVRSDRIEVHDVGGRGCKTPHALDRGGAGGIVSLATAEDEATIRIDGVERWRIRCEDGTWHAQPMP